MNLYVYICLELEPIIEEVNLYLNSKARFQKISYCSISEEIQKLRGSSDIFITCKEIGQVSKIFWLTVNF